MLVSPLLGTASDERRPTVTVHTAAYTLPAGEAPWRVAVGGMTLRLLAREEDTDGSLLVFRYDAPAGWPGPPLHRHSDIDEAVFVLAGQLTLRLGDDTHQVAAGGFAWMPRGEAHGFANVGDDAASFLGLVAPPGGMQPFFEAVAAEVGGADAPPDPERLMQLNAEHGIEVLGPPIGAGGG